MNKLSVLSMAFALAVHLLIGLSLFLGVWLLFVALPVAALAIYLDQLGLRQGFREFDARMGLKP